MTDDYVKNTIQAYQNTANEYLSRGAGEKILVHKPILEKFSSYLKGKDILEIGFAEGIDATWFTSNHYNYTGIEPVEAFFNKVHKLHPDLHLLNADIRDVELPGEGFDGIWAMASLLHLNDVDFVSVLKKCHTWLKKDGTIYVTLKEGVGDQIRDGKYFNFFTREKMQNFYGDLFELIDSDKVAARAYNTGANAWIDFYLRKL